MLGAARLVEFTQGLISRDDQHHLGELMPCKELVDLFRIFALDTRSPQLIPLLPLVLVPLLILSPALADRRVRFTFPPAPPSISRNGTDDRADDVFDADAGEDHAPPTRLET